MLILNTKPCFFYFIAADKAAADAKAIADKAAADKAAADTQTAAEKLAADKAAADKLAADKAIADKANAQQSTKPTSAQAITLATNIYKTVYGSVPSNVHIATTNAYVKMLLSGKNTNDVTTQMRADKAADNKKAAEVKAAKEIQTAKTLVS